MPADGDRVPLAELRPMVECGPLRTQPRPVRDLGWLQVRGGAAEQCKLLAVHAVLSARLGVPEVSGDRPDHESQRCYPLAHADATAASHVT